MRIAIVAPQVSAIREPQGGGSQAFVSDLARGLTRRGHEVHVYAATGSQIPGVQVIDTGIDPESLAATLFRARAPAGQAGHDSTGHESAGHDSADHEGADHDGPGDAPGPAGLAFAAVYSAVRQTRYDVVHNHAFDVPAVDLAASLPAPVVHTLHLPPDPAMAAALGRAGLRGAPPAACGVSEFQASAWRQLTPVEAVLPPFIPTQVIPFSRAAGSGVMFAGRLSPEKGAAEAIDIARAAGVAIDVYGDPYDVCYAREQIGPRGAEAGVTLHPGVPRAQLWTAMARAAAVLCPSQWDEPFGMAAAEAQACGTPVVAFRRGGLSEIVVDGVTGFLVPPGDIATGADAVRRAAAISRAACRDHAVTHLDLERSVDAHEHLYRRVTARSPAG